MIANATLFQWLGYINLLKDPNTFGRPSLHRDVLWSFNRFMSLNQWNKDFLSFIYMIAPSNLPFFVFPYKEHLEYY